jgi:hypothetical protein
MVPVSDLSVDQLPQRSPLSAITDAAGVCSIRFAVPGQVAWEVSQITVEMPDAPVGTTAFLRVNGALVTPLIPTGDAAAGDPPLPVYAGDVVEIRWEGATPGDQGRALLIYRTASYRR